MRDVLVCVCVYDHVLLYLCLLSDKARNAICTFAPDILVCVCASNSVSVFGYDSFRLMTA